MARLKFGNTTFRNVTGYRFALSLQGGGVLSASFQAIIETNQIAAVRNGTPPKIFEDGDMPKVGDSGEITVGLPLEGQLINGLELRGFVVFNIDLRVVGGITYSLLAFKSTGEWGVTPTLPDPRSFNVRHGGLVRLDSMQEFKPVIDTDSSGKVFSWRTDRSKVGDPIDWMLKQAGGNWTAQPSFHWYPTQSDGKTLKQNNPNKGMLFEELYGQFEFRRRFRAQDLERCFANATGSGVDELLRCDLDNVVELPVENDTAPVPFTPSGRFEERVSIVYDEDVSYPQW